MKEDSRSINLNGLLHSWKKRVFPRVGLEAELFVDLDLEGLKAEEYMGVKVKLLF